MNKIQDLLNWCRTQLNGYPNVSINNFTTSWKDGLAFNALIHKFKPELINFHELEAPNIYYNNYIAFKTAEIHFGIPALLDPKDMSALECPERLSIITYVSQFYNCLKAMKPESGYDINKFENTNNDNSDLENISSRASVSRLTRLKCSICSQKVYLLERYVADDKLYHRKCYREIQIQNIANESEIIGDYLNIYGELKPTMNKNIFVHPIQDFVQSRDILDIETKDPVDIIEESESQTDESEESSESLSSYDYDEHIFNEESDVNSEDDIILSNKEIHLIPNEVKSTEEREIEEVNCQENLVINIIKEEPIKSIKQRLYIKKRDKELPYSTFFEMSHDECIKLESEELRREVTSELSTTLSITAICNNNPIDLNIPNIELSNHQHHVKKLIEIYPEDDYESDISSIEEEPYEFVEPQITRNSIWRKPIIISIIAKKHKSACVPIEGKFRDYAEFKDRLEELNAKQSEVEVKARKIQQKLWEENANTPLYELLLAKWLDLVEEKDKIFYEENALYSWIKDLKLQEMKLKLEAQIRLLSSNNTNDPTTSEKEKELVAKLIETVNQRSELVDAMHEENVRRLEIQKLRHEAAESPSNQDSNSINQSHQRDKPMANIKKLWKRKTSHF